jgi:hypothetical protein
MGRVRSYSVVIEPPALDQGACLGQAGEHLRVQELVAQPADEALDEGICRGFPGAM